MTDDAVAFALFLFSIAFGVFLSVFFLFAIAIAFTFMLGGKQ